MPIMDRRHLLLGGAGLAAGGCANLPFLSFQGSSTDATGLAAQIRSGQMSAIEAVDAAIARAEAAQPVINFMVTDGFEQARDRTRSGALTGPFAGVPVLIKDLNDYVGLPTRDGSRATAGAAPATEQDGYISAFDAAGLVVIGKSATPEMGFSATTEPLAFGPTRNPWDLGHSSGGSSGGAAAAVAAGVVAVAHANDGGGSIRMPASCCGLFGLKPSRGRQHRDRPSSSPIDYAVQHVVSRSVRDSAGLLAVTEAQALPEGMARLGYVTGPSRRPLRIAVVRLSDRGQAPAADVDAGLTATQTLLTDMGHELIEARGPLPETFIDDFVTFWSSGALRTYLRAERLLGRAPDESLLEPFTLGLAAHAQQTGTEGIRQAIGRLQVVADEFNRWLGGYDVVLSPVLSTPPPPIGYLAPDVAYQTLVERMNAFMGHTPIHNVSGAPAMSVPLHWSRDGLPIGLQFSAAPGRERDLLELAYALEQARPWVQRRPSVWFG